MGNRKQLLPPLLFLVMVVSLGALFLSRCTFEKPSAPTWDVLFKLPLLGKTFTMEDLAEDLEELSIDEQTQEVMLHLEHDIETFQVGDQLSVEGVTKNFTIPSEGTVKDSVEIPKDIVVVDAAIIKEGTVTVEIENQNNDQLTVHFEMEDLYHPDGTTIFSFDGIIPGNQTVTFPQDPNDRSLENFIIAPPIHDGQNYIRFSATLVGGNQGDQVVVRLTVSDLIFSSIIGILNSMEVAIDSMETELGIPGEFKDFQIQSANLKLELDIGILFPIDVDIKIEALETEHDPAPAPIEITGHIEPAQTATIYFGDVADFINSHPEKILISGTITVGDGVTHATISEDHTIEGTAIFDAPLILTIPSYESKMDVDTLELDEDTRDIFRDNLREVRIIADVENGLPIGTNVSILFSKDRGDTTIYDASYTPDFTIQLELEPAPTTGTPGIVNGIASSDLIIELDEDDFRLFHENEELFIGFKFLFYGSSDSLVKFSPQDSIRIQAEISALVNTKIPEDDDEEEGGGS